MDYSKLPIILPGDVEGDHFAKGGENSKNFGKLRDKEVENLDYHCCLKNGGHADPNAYEMKQSDIVRVTHSSTKPQFNVQSEKQS